MANDNWLVFVDTNIFLDFYRQPGQSARRQMDGLLKHAQSLILTEQVQMEFLKNRQRVFADGFSAAIKPTSTSFPALIGETKFAKSYAKSAKKTAESFKKVQAYVDRVLLNPSRYDPVYKGALKLFGTESQLNLRRPSTERFSVRNLARKRFVLGYPPRKSDDTSLGDALNWEWIIHCAEKSKKDILIVSRDGDYGTHTKNASALNDWLRAEFKARVSRRRKIELTNKLTIALKLLDEAVTKEDEAAEEAVIVQYPSKLAETIARLSLSQIDPGSGQSLAETLKNINISKFYFPTVNDDSPVDDDPNDEGG